METSSDESDGFEAEPGERVLWSDRLRPTLSVFPSHDPTGWTILLSCGVMAMLLLMRLYERGPLGQPGWFDAVLTIGIVLQLGCLAVAAIHISATEVIVSDRRFHLAQPGLVQEIRLDETTSVVLEGQVLVWRGPVRAELKMGGGVMKLIMRRAARREVSELRVPYLEDPQKALDELEAAGLLPGDKVA